MYYIGKDFYKLHKDLVDLTKTNECFYICSQEYKDYIIQSYTYRLASYTEFCLPSALECRGTTFVIDKKDNSVHMFARPFEKFFNAYENPFTSEEVISKLKPISITEKMDGSLIMVGKLPNGEIIAKTKSTINSEQAKRATEIINKSSDYSIFCNMWIDAGFTPMFEYTAPTNQIVLFYPKEELTLIGLRNMITGEYANVNKYYEDPREGLEGRWSATVVPVVKEYKISIEEILKLQETGKNEGYVVQFDNGQRMKFKTLDYCLKHRAKDSIYNERNLAEIVLLDKLDDILPLIREDVNTMEYVNNFKSNLLKVQFNINSVIYPFYEENKTLIRKDYAIKAKEEQPELMGLLMDLYLEREVKVHDYIMKRELYKSLKVAPIDDYEGMKHD